MFTIDQIETAHAKVKSGADFPVYIHEIKSFGMIGFETFVSDSHTVYVGKNNFKAISEPQYEKLIIAHNTNKELFCHYLKIHQQGETDYFTFCKHCALTGIEKWVVNLDAMSCTYFDKSGTEILVEKIPG